MSDPYFELLDFAIHRLELLKAKGRRSAPLSPDVWAGLNAPGAPVLYEGSRRRGEVSGTAAPSEPTPAVLAEERGPSPALPSVESRLLWPGPATSQPSLTSQAKSEAVAGLRQRTLACQNCPHLAGSRRNVVFGVGDVHASLMFVGEAPGMDEDRDGEPFVGRAGQLLTRIIETMGFTRRTVYIANVLKCRPDTPGRPHGNRKPTVDEMKTCLPYLVEQIALIQPKVIVALGATAVEGLMGRAMPITRLRGQWQSFREVPVMPTYHPAYLLRNQALSEKRKVWEDMLQVLERLEMPISEKQRSYFLKA